MAINQIENYQEGIETMRQILTLPFVIRTQNQKEDLSYSTELACVAAIAESQRKKSSFLREKPEKISFISKIYYPLWAVPADNAFLAVDGLKSFTFEFTFQEPRRTGGFIEELMKNSISSERFTEALQAQAKTIREFASPFKLSFSAVVYDKELLNFFSHYFPNGLLQTVDEYEAAASLPADVDEKAAVEISQSFVNALRSIQADARGVQYALTTLSEELKSHREAASNEIENLKQKCEQQILMVKPTVDKNIKRITQKHDKANASLLRTLDRKVGVLEKRREKYLRKLQAAEQKKDAAQRRADGARKRKKTRSSLGSYEIDRYDRDINNTKKEVGAVSDAIDKLKREANNSLKQEEEEFGKAIAQEEAKITQINSLYGAKIALKQKQIKDTTEQGAALTASLEKRIEELKSESATLRNQVEIAWKTDDSEHPVFVQLPVYMIKYSKGKDEERYVLISPICFSEESSLFDGLKKILISEPRIRTLTRPASKRLQEVLTLNVNEKIEKEASFRTKLNGLCQTNNLIDLNTFPQTLNEGLDEIEKRGWMTPQEAAELCRRIVGEET